MRRVLRYRWNKRLRVLDISNIFARSVTLAERSKILWRMFAKSSNEFINLQEIIIRGNSLVSLQPETFCKVHSIYLFNLFILAVLSGIQRIKLGALKSGNYSYLKQSEIRTTIYDHLKGILIQISHNMTL